MPVSRGFISDSLTDAEKSEQRGNLGLGDIASASGINDGVSETDLITPEALENSKYYSTDDNATSSEIANGATGNKVVTADELYDAGVISDVSKSLGYTLSIINTTNDVAETNDTDFMQYISASFSSSSSSNMAMQISKDGLSWTDWAARSSNAGYCQYMVVPPNFYWRMRVSAAEVRLLSV